MEKIKNPEIENEEKLILQIKNIRTEKEAELKKVNAEFENMQNEGGSLLNESNEIAHTVASLTRELADCRVAVSTALSSIGEIPSHTPPSPCASVSSQRFSIAIDISMSA